MGLIQQIQDSAIDPTTDLPTLLRQCLLLAHRIKHEDLRRWAEYELEGYPDEVKLPDYRLLFTESRGNFAGPFGSGYKNYPIPTMALPESYHDGMRRIELRQSVSYFSSLQDADDLKAFWNPDAVVYVQDKILQGYVLMTAWKAIPPGSLRAILDTIRTRILKFSLEIGDSHPDSDPAPTPINLPAESVTPAFQNIILGNPTINYGGTSTTQNVAQQLVIQTKQDLHKVLLAQGVDAQSLSELDELLDEEEEPKEVKDSKVKEWAKKAFSGAAEQAKDFAAKAVAQYLDAQTRRITG